MNQGFILLHRQLLDWQWYTHLPCKVLFIHCLLKANHAPNKWRGQNVKRGEFITSIQNLAIETGLSVKQVRNALDILVESGDLGKASNTVSTLISVINYDKYQNEGKPRARQRANEGQTEGKRRANEGQQTINDINENQFNNETSLEEAPAPKFDFKKSLIDLGVPEQVAKDYIDQRTKKKASNSETAFKGIAKEIEKSGKTAHECIEMAIMRGWQGFQADWIKEDPKQNSAKTVAHIHTEKEKDYRKGWGKQG